MKSIKSCYFVVPILFVAVLLFSTIVEGADTAAQIDRDVDSAIAKLYASSPAAKELSKVSKGILVFPNVVKGGLIIGGQYGKGALRVDEKTVGYYSTAAASYGLQAGAQTFGYAMFFMTESALKYLKKSSGCFDTLAPFTIYCEVHVSPEVALITSFETKALTPLGLPVPDNVL